MKEGGWEGARGRSRDSGLYKSDVRSNDRVAVVASTGQVASSAKQIFLIQMTERRVENRGFRYRSIDSRADR